MTITSAAMKTAAFAHYSTVFPEVASLTRRNPGAPSIAPHKPILELLGVISEAVVSSVTNVVTVSGVGSGTNAGAGTITTVIPYTVTTAWAGLAAAKSSMVSSILGGLGWSGVSVDSFFTALVDGLVDYLASNAEIQFGPPPQTLGSGGVVLATADVPSLSAFEADVVSRVESEIAASPFFHREDDPAAPPVPELVTWCQLLVQSVSQALSTLNTSITVPPAGGASPTPITFSGASLT